MSAYDRHNPSLLSRLVWRVLLWLYHLKGFRLDGAPPDLPKYILLGAPHTTNWDFVIFAGAVRDMGIRPSFIGKHSLFRWPATRFMRDMGGMPVDRSRSGGYVQAVAERIAAADDIALVIAPEGSRTSDGRWRSGFWHIAKAAGIPFVPCWVNYETRRIGVGEAMMASDDFHADLARIADFYRNVRPDCDRFDVLAAQAEGEVSTPGKRGD